MDPRYQFEESGHVVTPALILFREMVEANVRKMVDIAGDPARLRPHCKTHKMREIVQFQLQQNIVKHKCATLAEAEMLAEAGAKDIFWAYNPVGPNVDRVVRFLERFPDVALSVTADHPRPLAALDSALRPAAGRTVDVLLDIDTGMNRTGLPVGKEAEALYRQIVESECLTPGGLHVYDGQNHQVSRSERAAAVAACWQPVAAFRDQLCDHYWPVPRIVAGGTGSFPLWAEYRDPALELSPGTCVLHDAGYRQTFPDLDFQPAAVLLTRVISRPTPTRITLDLGYKACASDPPAGNRLFFPYLAQYKEVLQNEEHLVLEIPDAERFEPGDELVAIPRHICPTVALHKQAHVVFQGHLVEQWEVAARDRRLTV